MARKGSSSDYVLPLAYWYGITHSIYCKSGSDCAYPAAQMLQIILDRMSSINIESLPGNERDHVYELKWHCNYVNTLLRKPSSSTDTIAEGCFEALQRFFCLLELVSVREASVLETLCLIQEGDDCWMTKLCSNCSDRWSKKSTTWNVTLNA